MTILADILYAYGTQNPSKMIQLHNAWLMHFLFMPFMSIDASAAGWTGTEWVMDGPNVTARSYIVSTQ